MEISVKDAPTHIFYSNIPFVIIFFYYCPLNADIFLQQSNLL